jgi:hypothetical protein
MKNPTGRRSWQDACRRYRRFGEGRVLFLPSPSIAQNAGKKGHDAVKISNDKAQSSEDRFQNRELNKADCIRQRHVRCTLSPDPCAL